VPGGQGAVVAPNLSARPFRRVEKVEIVHGDDPRGISRRQQQWMKRVGDIDQSAAEGLRGRPAEPMPAEVQEPDRDPPIDGAGSRDHVAIEPVLPGRRKQDDLFRRGRRAGDERARQLVHIFADTCPLAQRRPIVEQNPHGRDFDSFFTRVLA
jgi:hypothetical protein